MRSISRRPWLSNRQSSTRSALAENRAKFVPRPSQVAPSGCGAPAESRMLPLRDEKNCSKGRNYQTDLGNSSPLQRADRTPVPDIAAAVNGGIGVEDLVPGPGKRNLDAIVAVDFGGEIDHDQTALLRLASFAQPGEDTAAGVVHDQPLESARFAIQLVQCRQRAVQTIEIPDQSLHARRLGTLEQMPIERMVVPPFRLLTELVAHEQQLLAGVPEHEAVVGAQVRKALPFVTRHAAENGALAVHYLVMRERQDEV